MKKLHTTSGFTLIELLIAVTILGILVSIAVPNMSETSTRNAVKASHRNMLGAMHFARNEALTRSKMISLCPSVDGLVCDQSSTSPWSWGFIIFIDDGEGTGGVRADGIKNGDEEILLAHQSERRTSISVKTPTGTAVNSISWNYQGFVADDSRALVVVCDLENQTRFAQGLMLERTGRVMSSKEGNSGIHQSAFASSDGSSVTNSDLSCG